VRIPRAVEVVVVAVLWAAFIAGISVLTLTVPVYTSALTQALGVPESSGLGAADVVTLSAKVRSFVADPEAETLPAGWKGRPAFGPSEVSHLRDVRAVLSGARTATGAAALLLAAYVAWCVAKRRFPQLRGGMAGGAAVTAALVVLAAAVSFLDFDSFFAAFHGVFFAAGTWTFPYDSMLIRLFPEAFWAASGAAWAGLCLVAAGVLALASRFLRAAATNKYASRTANNV
jgi:integral membrane protein (TIGR01906 family)